MPHFDPTPENIEELLKLGRPPSYFDDSFTERVVEMVRKSRQEREKAKRLKVAVLKRHFKISVEVVPSSEVSPLPADPDVNVGAEMLAEVERQLVEEKLLEPDTQRLTEEGRRYLKEHEPHSDGAS